MGEKKNMKRLLAPLQLKRLALLLQKGQFYEDSNGIFTQKEKQRTAVKAFLGGQNVFTVAPTLGKSYVMF